MRWRLLIRLTISLIIRELPVSALEIVVEVWRTQNYKYSFQSIQGVQ